MDPDQFLAQAQARLALRWPGTWSFRRAACLAKINELQAVHTSDTALLPAFLEAVETEPDRWIEFQVAASREISESPQPSKRGTPAPCPPPPDPLPDLNSLLSKVLDLDWSEIFLRANEREGAGDQLFRQRRLRAALGEYQAVLEFRRYLAEARPDLEEWQRNLGAAHCRVGVVLQDQGNLQGALANYRYFLQIVEPLAAKEPANAEWQRDLWVAYFNLAEVSHLLVAPDAVAWWHRASAQLTHLKQKGMPLQPNDERETEDLKHKLKI